MSTYVAPSKLKWITYSGVRTWGPGEFAGPCAFCGVAFFSWDMLGSVRSVSLFERRWKIWELDALKSTWIEIWRDEEGISSWGVHLWWVRPATLSRWRFSRYEVCYEGGSYVKRFELLWESDLQMPVNCKTTAHSQMQSSKSVGAFRYRVFCVGVAQTIWTIQRTSKPKVELLSANFTWLLKLNF
jgi:hypothetical protein